VTKPGDTTPSAGNDAAVPLMLPGMPEAPERPPGDKRGKRRTWTTRARNLIAQGIHPLTRGPARPDLGTCGTCVHWIRADYHERGYRKCAKGPWTHSEQTDVRGWWPACHRYDPRQLPGEGQGVPDWPVSEDAARYIPPGQPLPRHHR
jgi:hypothetical protein